MHAVMEDIFADVVAPEYAQLMGVMNLRAPAAGDDASSGRGSSGSVDDFKCIPAVRPPPPPMLALFHAFCNSHFLSPPAPARHKAAVAYAAAHPYSNSTSSRGCVPHAVPLALVTDKAAETVRVVGDSCVNNRSYNLPLSEAPQHASKWFRLCRF